MPSVTIFPLISPCQNHKRISPIRGYDISLIDGENETVHLTNIFTNCQKLRFGPKRKFEDSGCYGWSAYALSKLCLKFG